MLHLALILACSSGTEVDLRGALVAGLRCDGLVPMASAVFHADGSLDLDGGTAAQGRGTWSLEGDRLTLVGSVHDPHADRYPQPAPAPIPTETVFEGSRLVRDGETSTLRYRGGEGSCR
jgi:hypothetical protein